ncbi:hypothetical protein LXL04_027751 [Taraxacum kok-saghyz]
MASLPFLISFTFNSAKASGSSARPNGSKLPPGSTGNSVTLNGTHQDDLCGPDGQDTLGMDQTWVTQIIKSTFAEDLGSSLEPYGLTELDTVTGQELREDAAKSSKHGPSAVDDFKLTVLGKGLWISRKSGGVPPVVTWEFTGQNGPRYFTRSGPYHGLPDGATFFAAAVFLIETRPLPKSSELEGAVFTACPAKGDERAMLEAAIVDVVIKKNKPTNLRESSNGRCWDFIPPTVDDGTDIASCRTLQEKISTSNLRESNKAYNCDFSTQTLHPFKLTIRLDNYPYYQRSSSEIEVWTNEIETIEEIFLKIVYLPIQKKAKKAMFVIASSVLKGIWECRNKLIFKNEQMEIEVAFRNSQDIAFLWISSRNSKFKQEKHVWMIKNEQHTCVYTETKKDPFLINQWNTATN